MPRVNNWPSVLSAEIETARAEPFEWGRHDCCLWAATVALALTGRDFAKDYRGRYNTARAAVKLWRAHTGGLLGLVHDNCVSAGFDVVHPALAKRGDIIGAKQEEHYLLGVCLGRQFAAVGVSGLVFKSMADAVSAWRAE